MKLISIPLKNTFKYLITLTILNQQSQSYIQNSDRIIRRGDKVFTKVLIFHNCPGVVYSLSTMIMSTIRAFSPGFIIILQITNHLQLNY